MQGPGELTRHLFGKTPGGGLLVFPRDNIFAKLSGLDSNDAPPLFVRHVSEYIRNSCVQHEDYVEESFVKKVRGSQLNKDINYSCEFGDLLTLHSVDF